MDQVEPKLIVEIKSPKFGLIKTHYDQESNVLGDLKEFGDIVVTSESVDTFFR